MVKRDRILRKLICATFLIFNFYYWYRYVFKYNSTHTSPTYSDTPFLFQIGKYVFSIALFVLLIIITLLGKERKLSVGKTECALICLLIWIFVKSIFQGDFLVYAKMIVFILPAYFVVYCDIELLRKNLLHCIELVLLYHVIYSIIQFILYFLFGRLPALAYSDSLIRFGGGWDDPNAFAVFLIIPISYFTFFILKNGISIRSITLLIVCIILEIFTFSYSGYISVAILCVVAFREFLSKKRFWLILFIMLFIAGAVIIKNYANIVQISSWKLESASTHFEALMPKYDGIIAAMFGNSKYTASENFYNIILSNYGAFALILYIGIEIKFIKIAYKNYKFSPDAINFTAFVFLLGISISQIGIPYMIIFPINYLFYLFSFASLAYSKTNAN